MRKTLLRILLLYVPGILFGSARLGAQPALPLERIGASAEADLVKEFESRQTAVDWKSSSVLASGHWVQVQTDERGVYRIPFSSLESWGFSDPSEVCLYGNGGYMLPKMNSSRFNDDLTQIPVWQGRDANNEDCLFFYSAGTVQWSYYSSVNAFRHTGNDYSDVSFFYLSDVGTPLVVEQLPAETAPVTDQVTSFLDYQLYEVDAENLIHSGRRWFGPAFLSGASRQFSFLMSNLVPDQPLSIYIELAGRSSQSSSFRLTYNDRAEATVALSAVDTSDPLATFASVSQRRITISNPAASSMIGLTYNASTSSASGWLDYIEVNASRNLVMDGSYFSFRNPSVTGVGRVSQYTISGIQNGFQLWNVSSQLQPTQVAYNLDGDQAQFTASSESLQEYVAFNPAGNLPEVELVEQLPNQNLHAMTVPEMLIISHADFMAQAEQLAAFHRANEQLDVAVVDCSRIYHEYSSGIADVAGIRNFIRSLYEKSEAGKFKYVLFMGGGNYDNKNILGANLNFIPTYQSENSLLPTASFVTDDFFVLLDEDEGEYSGFIDLGIGRIPARTPEEAQVVVDKIEHYASDDTFGEWRNVVCFIADDEDANTHMYQADQIASSVNNDMQAIATNKIYFDAFTEVTGPSGNQYPEVTDAINQQVQDGVLVLNYTGHANEFALADERVLNIQDIQSWTNYNRLPVFVTATCEFSRFDSEDISGGETILFSERGGGIALFSTTRVVYSNPNYVLNNQFYQQLFQRDTDGQYLRMGDVMRRTKNAVNTGINKRNFMLLGDPALRVAIPHYDVLTTSINGQDPATITEPIGALSEVVVTGRIVDASGATVTDFSGEIIPVVYDKAVATRTQGNNGQTPFEYELQNSRIYKGISTVTNGEFEFSFIVPRDISYAVGNGKILYYATNGEIDAHGTNSMFEIGGNSGNEIDDTTGPEIEAYLNSPSFELGDEVGVNSILYLNLSDASGINTVGTGIGHDMTAILDRNNSNVIVLNDYYLSDLNSFSSGTVVFPLSDLEVGEHSLTIKVWDIVNNSSEITIYFKVTDDFRIEDVISYPNPVTDYARFKILHNRPDELMDATVELYDTQGRLIDMVTERLSSSGTETVPLYYDISDRQLIIRSGACVYRVILSTLNGDTASKSGVLIILRR